MAVLWLDGHPSITCDQCKRVIPSRNSFMRTKAERNIVCLYCARQAKADTLEAGTYRLARAEA